MWNKNAALQTAESCWIWGWDEKAMTLKPPG